MTKNDALTYGAVALAAFTLFYVFKKTPAKAVATQPGQQQRDAGLLDWHSLLDTQANDLSVSEGMYQYRQLTGTLGF